MSQSKGLYCKIIMLILVMALPVFADSRFNDVSIRGYINSTNGSIRFSNFTSCNLETNSTGDMICGTDDTGAGGGGYVNTDQIYLYNGSGNVIAWNDTRGNNTYVTVGTKLGNTTPEIRSVFGNSSNISYDQNTGVFIFNGTSGGADGIGPYDAPFSLSGGLYFLNSTFTAMTDLLYNMGNITNRIKTLFAGNISSTNLSITGTADIATIRSDAYQNSTGSLEWIRPGNIFDVDDEDIETDLNTYIDIAGDSDSGAYVYSFNGSNASFYKLNLVNGSICDAVTCYKISDLSFSGNTTSQIFGVINNGTFAFRAELDNNFSDHRLNYKHGNTTDEIRAQFSGSPNISIISGVISLIYDFGNFVLSTWGNVTYDFELTNYSNISQTVQPSWTNYTLDSELSSYPNKTEWKASNDTKLNVTSPFGGSGGNVTGTYTSLSIKPCANGEILEYSAAGWVCGTDDGGASPWNATGTRTYLNATENSVGIGITTPGYKLEVSGNASVSNLTIQSKVVTSLNSTISFEFLRNGNARFWA